MILKYDIAVTGEQNVARAMASIERRFIMHNARMMRAGQRATGVSAGAMANRRAAGPGSEAKAVERESRQVENYWRRAHQRSADFKIREDARASKAAERLIERETKAKERAAKRSAAAEARAAERAAKKTQASRQRFADGTFGTVGRSVRGSLSAVGTMGGAALGLAGGFAAAGAIQSVMAESSQASRLANQAGNPALKGQLLKDAQGVRGFTGAEALGGIEEFVTKTGDLETARKIIGDMGTLALATGTDLGDLGATAGQAFNVLKDQIEDPIERIKQLKLLMGALAEQGSMGAVEIRDLAQDFGKLGAATRSFEGGAPDLLRAMGAFSQIAVARGGAESSADASTAASRLAGDIVMHKDRFKGLGVDIKSKVDPTKLKNPMEIMADVLEATGGDIEKTNGLFGIESGKIFKGLGATYSEAEKKQKGSGRAAIEAEFKRYSGAKLDDKQLNERAESRLSDSDLQFKELMKEFNSKIGSELLPVLTRLIPQFAKLMPYVERAATLFGKMVDAFAEDPFAGLAKIVAAKLAFDVAVSSLGSTAERLKNAMVGAADSVDGVSQKLGKAGSAMVGLELGLATATIIVTSGIVNFEKSEADAKSSGEALNVIRDAEKRAAEGKSTPQDLERITQARDVIRKNEADAKKTSFGEEIAQDLALILFGKGTLDLAGTNADEVGTGIMNPSKQTSINTQSGMSAEAEKRFNSTAALLEAAAKKMAASAGASPAPNRGNDPKIPTG